MNVEDRDTIEEIIGKLERMPAENARIDDLIYKATELLRDVRDAQK